VRGDDQLPRAQVVHPCDGETQGESCKQDYRKKPVGCASHPKTRNDMTQKQKEMIKLWFNHIKQMATDRKTLNGVVMGDAFCLDEIRALAHEASELAY